MASRVNALLASVILSSLACKPINGSTGDGLGPISAAASIDDLVGSISQARDAAGFQEKLEKLKTTNIDTYMSNLAVGLSGKTLMIEGRAIKIPTDFAAKSQASIRDLSHKYGTLGKYLAAMKSDPQALSTSQLRQILSQSLSDGGDRGGLSLMKVNCAAASGSTKGGALAAAGGGGLLGAGIVLSFTPLAPIGWWLAAYGGGLAVAGTTTAATAAGVMYGAKCGDEKEALNPGKFGSTVSDGMKPGTAVVKAKLGQNDDAAAGESATGNSSGT